MSKQRKNLTSEQKTKLQQQDASAKLAWFGSVLRQSRHDSIGNSRRCPFKMLANAVMSSRAVNTLFDVARPARPLIGISEPENAMPFCGRGKK